jgi:O-acetyl-ADP-ribose deacetylase (regulator of RNase III)
VSGAAPVRVVFGDALDALASGAIQALGHQVNLRGVMGAGIAGQIRRQWPTAYACYQAAIRTRQLALGDILPVEVLPGRWVVHLAGQIGVDRGRQTDYAALAHALGALAAWAQARSCRVGLPYGLGCGLAGGDWRIVAALIARHCPAAVLYRLPV